MKTNILFFWFTDIPKVSESLNFVLVIRPSLTGQWGRIHVIN